MDCFSTITTDDNQVEEIAFDLALMEVFGPEKPNLDSPQSSRDFFYFVQNLINDLAEIVDKVRQVPAKKEERQTLRLKINAPVHELIRQIVSEIKLCEVGSEEKTKTILNMLEKYSLIAKATLTLAAFAVEFGDFCLFATIQHFGGPCLSTLKKLAILKGVPIFENSSELLEQRVHEIKETIEAILQVMDANFKVEDLHKIVQDLHGQLPEQLQMDEVYYLIITSVVACAIEVSNLTSDKEADESLILSSNLKKFQEVFNTLNEQRITLNEQQIILHKEQVRIRKYDRIKELFDSPTVEILNTMFLLKDDQLELVDVSASHDKVQIDVLRGKTVFLFISSLDNISEIEISALKLVYEETKKDNDYKIVWIPMVDQQWSDELRNKFETILSSSNEMFGYVLPLFSQSIPGLRHIKKDWKLNDKPILVMMSSEGEVYSGNAFHDISKYGKNFFAFVEEGESMAACQGEIINYKKYIFFYGGKDKEWIKKFEKKATALACNPLLEYVRTKIEHYPCVEKKEKTFLDVARDFLSRKDKKNVTKEIEKLLSNKNLSGWAVLCKGYTVVISGDGHTFLRVLEEFEDWKINLLDQRDFDTTFKDHYAKTCKN